jgi:hypothetical protein
MNPPGFSQSQIVVYGYGNILLRSKIAFRGLDRKMTEQEFDLLQIAAILPAQLGTCPTKIMSAEVLDSDLLR